MTKSTKVDIDVSMIIRLINDCQDFGVMPEPGGLLQQDALFMYILHEVQSARAVRAEIDNNKTSNSVNTNKMKSPR